MFLILTYGGDYRSDHPIYLRYCKVRIKNITYKSLDLETFFIPKKQETESFCSVPLDMCLLCATFQNENKKKNALKGLAITKLSNIGF